MNGTTLIVLEEVAGTPSDIGAAGGKVECKVGGFGTPAVTIGQPLK